MTKLEEVARAIARVHYARKEFSGWCTLDARLNYLVNKYWGQFVPDAKAAIEAMRVPTDAMADAIGQEMDAYLGAIDAALND